MILILSMIPTLLDYDTNTINDTILSFSNKLIFVSFYCHFTLSAPFALHSATPSL